MPEIILVYNQLPRVVEVCSYAEVLDKVEKEFKLTTSNIIVKYFHKGVNDMVDLTSETSIAQGMKLTVVNMEGLLITSDG